MRHDLERSLDRMEKLVAEAAYEPDHYARVIVTLPPIQDAYEKLLLEALSLLGQGYLEDSLQRLQLERDQMAACFERIAGLIHELAEVEEPLARLIVEYLYTRSRILDEMKMFPEFGLELLAVTNLNESLGKIILRLEKAMLGRHGLYQDIMNQFAVLQESGG